MKTESVVGSSVREVRWKIQFSPLPGVIVVVNTWFSVIKLNNFQNVFLKLSLGSGPSYLDTEITRVIC